MKKVSKNFWMITLGFILSIMYVSFGVLLCISIIGIPFALKYFKLSEAAINPSNKRIKVNYAYNIVMNTIWFLFFGGVVFFVIQIVFGLLSMITVIGYNAGKDIIKNSLAVAFPFGMEITDTKKEFDYVPYENEKYKGRKKIKSLIVIGLLIIITSILIIGLLVFGIYTLLEEKNYFNQITDFNSFVDTIKITIENNGVSVISKNKFLAILILVCIFLYLFIDLGVVLLRKGIKGKVIKRKQSFSSRFSSSPEERMHIRANEARHDSRPEYKSQNTKKVVVTSKAINEIPRAQNAFMNQKDENDFGFDMPKIEEKIFEPKMDNKNNDHDQNDDKFIIDNPVELEVVEENQEVIDDSSNDGEGLFIPEDDFDII